MEKKKKRNELLEASTAGLNIVVATLVGFAMGYYLDKYLGTKPWLTIIFLFLGIIAGFKDLYMLARRYSKDEKEEDGRREHKNDA